MNKSSTTYIKHTQSDDKLLEAETAINEEVHKYKLDFSELSPTIREILGSVYIRGGIEALKKIKEDNPQL